MVGHPIERQPISPILLSGASIPLEPWHEGDRPLISRPRIEASTLLHREAKDGLLDLPF